MDPMLLLALAALAIAGVAIVFAVRNRTPAAAAPAEPSRDQINDTVKAAAAEALRANSEQFMQLARAEIEKLQTAATTDLEKRERAIAEMVKPIQDGLTSYQDKLAQIERERVTTFTTFHERLRELGDVSVTLRRETTALAESLKSSTVRGTWGEVVLERVVELAGMTEHCDFEKQATLDAGDRRLRPDLVVKLPGGRTIAVDAKAPLSAYIEAMGCTDEPRRAALLAQHARAVRDHAKSLGRKEYWSQFERSPEFVVMFLPGEAFYAAALQEDPSLIEAVVSDKVILASPTSLIALLKAAAFGWQQEAITETAEQVQELGRELYDRLAKFTEHLAKVGDQLEKATRSYNAAVGSLDSRVLVSARRMKELGRWSSAEIEPVEPVEITPRLLEAPDLELPEITPKPPELPA
jgi:DNA recombination protein RmuC